VSLADRLEARLVEAWYRAGPDPLASLLRPPSWLFGMVVRVRRGLYASGGFGVERLAVPVVVVGNLAVGGTGKTPLVIALAQALAARGRRPGVISRGYGASARAARIVSAADAADAVGDEPLLVAAAGLPIASGIDRVAAGRLLLERHPEVDVVIADDGLQHYRLHRDVEVAVVDGERGFGNGLLLPAGPLREPRSRLAEVDALVTLVREDGKASPGTPAEVPGRATLMTHEPVRWRRLVAPSAMVDPSAWPRGSVHAVAGIGHPQRFFDLVARMGIVAVPHAFPDHHRFVPADLEFPGASAILMTAKDAVKCAAFADARMVALDIRAVIDPRLVDLVQGRLDGRQAA
jgi:tetraacyldisaccharide 4'-kinase